MARPALIIDPRSPSSELAGEAAAALAAASILFAPQDRDYSRRLLDRAKSLFDFADRFRGPCTGAILTARDYYPK